MMSSLPEEAETHVARDMPLQNDLAGVPPIRKLAIRGRVHPPSQTTLRDDAYSARNRSISPPLKSQVSFTLRKTVTELERMLNEALAESAIRSRNRPSSVQGSDWEERNHGSDPSNPTAKSPQMKQNIRLDAKPRQDKHNSPTQKSFRPKISPLLESQNIKAHNLNRGFLPFLDRSYHSSNDQTVSKKSAPAPASVFIADLCELDQLKKNDASNIITIPSLALNSKQEKEVEEHHGTKRKEERRPLTRQQPDIKPRSSSTRQELTSGHHNPATSLTVPKIHLNGQEYLENQQSDADLPLTHFKSTRHFTEMFGTPSKNTMVTLRSSTDALSCHKISLKRKGHVDVYNCPEGFNIFETSHHASVARHWPSSRKRFAAYVACINTSCIGILLGTYAGEVPAIQYVIADTSHYAILGNVLLYIGLALSSFLFWPLPLLHGRKPYVVTPLLVALATQVPQGLAVSSFRDPNVATYRGLLLVSRAVCGLALGLSDMNFLATLLDLYGASLQSINPSQGEVDPYDVRRHGGGMGIWLAVWSWCSIGSISLSFMVGASIIDNGASVTWGFWTNLIILMFVLFLNIIGPEARRSAFRRTISEIIGNDGSFSRVTRGEIMMHIKQSGPYWWGQEVFCGLQMCWRMVKQPGFLILSVYAAWVYAEYTLVLMFLGSLTSRTYRFRPVFVGLCSLSLAGGAALALPFQRASWLSQSRTHPPHTDSFTVKEKFGFNSHITRRILFTTLLPLAAIGYTLCSMGSRIPVAVPCFMASIVGFLSNLAIAECYSLIMENFDTSDLQPGMTGRPNRKSVAANFAGQRTNFSCYPRVSAGMIVTQTLKYILAAAATGVGGRIQQNIGTVFATSVVAGILFVLTILLTAVLFRWKTVQMIPGTSKNRLQTSVKDDKDWEPVILGNPSGTTRKLNILELGSQTRWSEIRRRNHIQDNLTGDQGSG